MNVSMFRSRLAVVQNTIEMQRMGEVLQTDICLPQPLLFSGEKLIPELLAGCSYE